MTFIILLFSLPYQLNPQLRFDQAKSVWTLKYWCQDRAKQSRKCLLFPIVYGILQLFISLKPIDQFQWDFLQNVALKMVHTVD